MRYASSATRLAVQSVTVVATKLAKIGEVGYAVVSVSRFSVSMLLLHGPAMLDEAMD